MGKNSWVSGVLTIKNDINGQKKVFGTGKSVSSSHLSGNTAIRLEYSRLNWSSHLVGAFTSERVFLECPISLAFQRIVNDCWLVAFVC